MRSVLILVDDYTSAEAAARHVAGLAASAQAERALLLSVPAPVRSYAAQFFALSALRDMRTQDAARLAGNARGVLEAAGIKVEFLVEQGEAASVTADFARARAVDAIVMASPGAGFFRQLMFRLLVWQVVRRASVPVLIVGTHGETKVAERTHKSLRPAYPH